jgi:2-dehydro-3-deoxyphosphooctonate aldolase (KDO 8-P synthase)
MPSCARFRVGDVVVGGPLPIVILGPCVIEGSDHALRLAGIAQRAAARAGLPIIFKASFDKANRTSHRSYRGPGLAEGLEILAMIRHRTGLPVTTDVHERDQVEAVAKVVDLLQVPAFLCRQTDLVTACARSGRPTSIKKGQFLAPWDCRALVDKFRAAGGRALALIERGCSFGYNNLVADFRSLPLLRELGVPVIFDATHSVQSPGGRGDASGGDGRLAPALVRAACAVGVDGIFMEIHNDPPNAKSDGANALPTRALGRVLADIRRLHDCLGRPGPGR